MTVDEIHSKILEILSHALKESHILGETLREQTPKWDSLKHLEIVFAVEDAFSVEFGEDEIPALNSSLMIAEKVAVKKET